MRIAFLGSPPFATPILRRLLDPSAKHEVVCLVTPPDRPRGRGRSVVRSELATLADEASLPVIQPETTKTDDFVEGLRAHRPDALVVASYGEILRTPVLELAPHGALNVHGSLLPRWRGASPIQRAIAAGDSVTGVSIQRMVLALDAGDVLLSKETPIGPDDTAADLFDRLSELGADAIVEALDRIEAGTAEYQPQNTDLVTLAPKLRKEDGHIDFGVSADDVARHVRAMTTWPGARCFDPEGRAIVVLKAAADPSEVEQPDVQTKALPPGTLLNRGGRMVVAAANGTEVELAVVKPAGKGAMSGDAFLRGARLAPGDLITGSSAS